MTNPSVTIHLELTPWQAAQLSEAVRLHKSHLITEWRDAGERASVIAISAAEIQRMLTAINDEILKPKQQMTVWCLFAMTGELALLGVYATEALAKQELAQREQEFPGHSYSVEDYEFTTEKGK